MQLVILAAGMGSRFGGLKQMEPMDDYGNFLLDYSVLTQKERVLTVLSSLLRKISTKHLKIQLVKESRKLLKSTMLSKI